MENNDNINADWARKTATAILGEKIKSQLSTCLTEIKRAVSRNEMATSLSMHADKLTIQELEKRGFKVSQVSDQRDGDYLTIQW